jgi:hypothetical protein
MLSTALNPCGAQYILQKNNNKNRNILECDIILQAHTSCGRSLGFGSWDPLATAEPPAGGPSLGESLASPMALGPAATSFLASAPPLEAPARLPKSSRSLVVARSTCTRPFFNL